MKIAICDDEKEYRDLIEAHVNFYFKEKCIDFSCIKFSSGEDLISSNDRFDIIFLDIEMDKLNGIQTAKSINNYNSNAVIFIVTAYQKYLDDAMDLNVFRYIDKPLNSKRLYSGLDKAIDFINNNEISINTRNDGIIKIKKSDIIFVEVIRKNVYVTTFEKRYLVREKMDFFRQNLTASFFAIPHNSYIVNLNYVTTYKRDILKLQCNQEISIAPKKQPEMKRKFLQFMGEGYGNLSDNF